MTRLDDIKARLEAAKDFIPKKGIPVESDQNWGYQPPVPMKYADFIYEAKNDLEYLISRVETLEAEQDRGARVINLSENKHFAKVLIGRRNELLQIRDRTSWWRFIRRHDLRIRYETILHIEAEILRAIYFESKTEEGS